MAHEHNKQSMDKKQNLARFFIEQQHVAWVSRGCPAVGHLRTPTCRRGKIRTFLCARRW